MIPAQRIRGPKTLVVNAENTFAQLGAGNRKVEKSNSFLVNTAPYAGKLWELHNVYFSFPSATKFYNQVTSKLEIEFSISMSIGGLVVAKQEILETTSSSSEESTLHLLGSLEPFVAATVYSGEGVEFTVTMKIEIAKGNLGGGSVAKVKTGPGGIVMNFSLARR